MIFLPAVSASFVGFRIEKHPLHVLKPCKIRAEIVHLLPDKLKTTSSDNDLTALVRVTAHQKSSLGGYYYDEPAFLPLITFVNSVVSTACAVLLYLALRPALECTGLLTKAEAKQTPRPATPKAKSPTPAFPVRHGTFCISSPLCGRCLETAAGLHRMTVVERVVDQLFPGARQTAAARSLHSCGSVSAPGRACQGSMQT